MLVNSFQIAQHLKRAIGAPVVNEEEFVPEVHPAENPADLGMKFLEGVFLVEEGDDD